MNDTLNKMLSTKFAALLVEIDTCTIIGKLFNVTEISIEDSDYSDLTWSALSGVEIPNIYKKMIDKALYENNQSNGNEFFSSIINSASRYYSKLVLIDCDFEILIEDLPY